MNWAVSLLYRLKDTEALYRLEYTEVPGEGGIKN